MKSMIVTLPCSVWNSVSRMRVSFRGIGEWTARRNCVGASFHRPCSGVPKMAAKQAPESKRGQHNQSMEASFATRAAVSQSPISP